LPTMLLYDAAGLKLFEQITYLDEYYLTGAEISVLQKWPDSIAERIEDDSVVVELGSGYGFPLRHLHIMGGKKKNRNKNNRNNKQLTPKQKPPQSRNPTRSASKATQENRLLRARPLPPR